MEWFRINQPAVQLLTLLVMGLTITFALWQAKHKSTPTRLLLAFFAAGDVYFIARVGNEVVYAPWRSYLLSAVLPTLLFGLMAFLQFAYRFPQHTFPRESRIVLALSLLAALLGVGLSLPFPQIPLFTVQSRPTEVLLLYLMIATEFFWTITVLVRQTIVHSTNESEPRSRRPLWQHLWKPQGKLAGAARSFALVMLTPVLLVCVATAFEIGLLREDLYRITLNLGLLLMLFTFATVYLNHAAETTTLTTKWVLGTLLALLAVLNITSQITLPAYEMTYDEGRLRDAASVKDALLTATTEGKLRAEVVPPQVAYVISQPTLPGDRSNPYTLVFVRDAHFVLDLANQHPPDQNLQLDANAPDPRGDTGVESQVQIDPSGIPARFTRQVGDDFFAFYNVVRFVRGDQTYEIGFNYSLYRLYIHEHALLLVVLILVSSLAVVLLFPFFFRTNLLEPLNHLLEGVRHVNAGRRDVLVPVQYSDEIGFLTGSFNNMVATIKHGEDSKEELLAASARFVPYEFFRLLDKASIVDVKLGDHSQMAMSVLFSDIRGYTTLSERMTPGQNFDFLNEYLSYISPAIRAHGGFIDQYYGDGIKALFPDRPEDALCGAIELRRALARCNAARLPRGENPVQIGIGLHISTLMLGTIGEDPRMTVTVIGDAVNTTARLEGLNKLYGTTVIASEQLLRAVPNPDRYHFRFLGRVQVKGKNDPIAIFELYDGDNAGLLDYKQETRADFERGLQFYQNAQFAQACDCFARVLAHHAADQAARIYHERSSYFLERGAPPGWRGVEVLTDK